MANDNVDMTACSFCGREYPQDGSEIDESGRCDECRASDEDEE